MTELDAIEAATVLLDERLPSREVVLRLIDVGQQIFPSDAVALWTHNARDQVWRIAASRGLSPDYEKASVPAEGAAALREPLLAPDVSGEAFRHRQEIYKAEGIVSLLAIPLNAHGEGSATITFYYRQPRTFSEQDNQSARILGRIASSALRSHRLDRLAEISRVLSGELDLHRLVQSITDAATELTGAQFGAFFYNVLNQRGESYMLYTISGVPREAFSRFPMPRNTPVFAPTFSGTGTVLSANIREDPRYGTMPPHHGMPKGHLPVVSYLAVPVMARSGEVLGGLFFGHEDVGIFTESEARIAEGLAAQAAVGIDNARLYETLKNDRAIIARNEARYRSLVMAAPTAQAIGTMSSEGLVVEDSPSWREITGQSFDDMRGHGWLDAVHPDDRDHLREAWSSALAGGATTEQIYRVWQRDGTYRWFAGKLAPVLDDEGRITEWMTTAADIHDRKTSEDHLRFIARASELLVMSLDYETTLRSLASISVPTLADWCTIDLAEGDGYRRLVVAHADPQKIAFAEELQSRYPQRAENDRVLDVLRTGIPSFVSHVPAGLIEQTAQDEHHLGLLKELGVTSWMIIPLRARGRVIGAMSFVAAGSHRRFTDVDFTHAQELARTASLSIDNTLLFAKAQEANRAKDEFLATLSHELRTPMTAVLGWARMLGMGLDPDEQTTAIEAIERSAEAQAQIIDDILDVSRIISGKLLLTTRPVDLSAILEAALTTVRPAAEAKGVEILTNIRKNPPRVAGDASRLQQVFWNLLSNAIKFTPRGGSVTVRVHEHGSLVRVLITDSGKGIHKDFLPYVFEPFRQADSSTTREFGGLGLGLAIVRYLVELHGGRVTASSDGEGLGATFAVELPAIEALAGVEPQDVDRYVESKMASSEALPSLAGATVMVIDDQLFTRQMLQSVMRRCGAEVLAAASVQEAVALLEEHTPDVFVCDIAMPVEDGFAFLRILRQLPGPVSERPVIALTAFGRAEDRQRILDAGFDLHVRKPVEPVDLARTVASLL